MQGNECWARIVIVSFNSGEDLQTCVNHLLVQSFEYFEVVIVDNASPDNAVDDLILPDERFTIIKANANLGFAGGSNLGAKGAVCPWIITLNPDAWPEIHWLESLNRAANVDSCFSILGSTLVSAQTKNTLESFGDTLTIFGLALPCANGMPVSSLPERDVEVFSCCGAGAAYERKVFEEIGGFDESFFCYLEDVDIAYRMRLIGKRCLQVPDAKVVHFGSSSSNKTPNFKTYYTQRNNVRLLLKNTPFLLLLVMFPSYIGAMIWLIWRNRKKVNNRVVLTALKDAMKAIPQTMRLRKQNLVNSKCSSFAIAKKLGWSKSRLRGKRYLFWLVG